MDDSPNTFPLQWNDADWSVLLGATERLETAWREPRLPNLADFVPVPSGDPRHTEMLLRLWPWTGNVAAGWVSPRNSAITPASGPNSRAENLLRNRRRPLPSRNRRRAVSRSVQGQDPRYMGSRRSSRGRLRILCPHCHHAVEIVDENVLAQIDCPSCGSSFSLVDRGVPVDRSTTGQAHIRRTIAHFELIEQLGVGAFGSVWKAKDTQLDKPVALKIPRAGSWPGRGGAVHPRGPLGRPD